MHIAAVCTYIVIARKKFLCRVSIFYYSVANLPVRCNGNEKAFAHKLLAQKYYLLRSTIFIKDDAANEWGGGVEVLFCLEKDNLLLSKAATLLKQLFYVYYHVYP